MKNIILAPIVFFRFLFQSIFLALSQIWANKTRAILTTIGIIIGVASVTAVIAALSGLKAKVLSDLESFGANNMYLGAVRPDTGPKRRVSWWSIRFLPKHFDNLLEHCPSVESFTRISWGGRHTIRYGERSVDGIRTRGVEPSWNKIENRPVIMGRPFSVLDGSQGRQVCLIDTDLRDKLRLDRDCLGDCIMIDSRTFRIVGIIEKKPDLAVIGGGYQEDSEVFIPFRTHLKIRQRWIYAVATSKSTDVTEEAQAEISFFLRRTRQIKPGEPDTFRVQSVKSEIKKFNEMAAMITLVASGVVGISLLVGGVGIMNIMLVSVSERTREIGLRKAVGARKSAILTQFLVESIVLCLIGCLVGVGFGQLLTNALSNIPKANLEKAYIPGWAILLAFGFSALVGVFFGMFPAIKAAKLDPIEALRHE